MSKKGTPEEERRRLLYKVRRELAAVLQDAYHYAAGSSGEDSVFATRSLRGRLELLDKARSALARAAEIVVSVDVVREVEDTGRATDSIESEQELLTAGVSVTEIVLAFAAEFGIDAPTAAIAMS